VPNPIWTRRSLFQLTLIGLCDTVQVVNVHHFEASTALEATFTNDSVAQGYAGTLADHWLTNAKDTYLGCHTTDYTLQMVKCQVLERPGNFRHKLTSIERPQTTANVGTSGSVSSVGQVAATIRWRTPVAGKSHRGRSYIGPITPDWMSNGSLTAPGVTAVNAYAQDMIALYGVAGTYAGNLVLTVYSRPYNTGEYQYTSRKTGTLAIVTPLEYAGNSTNVTAAMVDTVLRTQRRRELGVGA
jgi:hypothetical protein